MFCNADNDRVVKDLLLLSRVMMQDANRVRYQMSNDYLSVHLLKRIQSPGFVILILYDLSALSLADISALCRVRALSHSSR